MTDDPGPGVEEKRERQLVVRSVARKDVDYQLIVQALLMIAEDIARSEATLERDEKEV